MKSGAGTAVARLAVAQVHPPPIPSIGRCWQSNLVWAANRRHTWLGRRHQGKSPWQVATRKQRPIMLVRDGPLPPDQMKQLHDRRG
jgi:hypothetical protein